METQPSAALSAINEFAELLPEKIRSAYLALPPDSHSCTEKELRKKCYPKKKDPITHQWLCETLDFDDRLRHSFWLEFELAISQNRPMVYHNVWQRITTEGYFLEVLKNPRRCAWITYPPGSYTVDVETLLHRTTNRLFEMVEVPFTHKICRCHYTCKCRPKGVKPDEWDVSKCACKQADGCKCPEKVDVKAMELMLKVRESLELRAKGSIAQIIRSSQQNLNVNVNQSVSGELSKPETPEELEKKLLELRAKMDELNSSNNRQEVITIDANERTQTGVRSLIQGEDQGKEDDLQ